MNKELEQIESKLSQHTNELVERFEFKKMKVFFNNITPQEGVNMMHENSITAKESIQGIINNQIRTLEEIKKLDLQEEAVTAKMKTMLIETIDKAIELTKEEA